MENWSLPISLSRDDQSNICVTVMRYLCLCFLSKLYSGTGSLWCRNQTILAVVKYWMRCCLATGSFQLQTFSATLAGLKSVTVNVWSCPHMHTHTHTHPHTHTHTHTHIHIHSDAHTHTSTHTLTHSLTHIYIYTHTSLLLTLIHKNPNTQPTLFHLNMAFIQAHTHSPPYTHTYTHRPLFVVMCAEGTHTALHQCES